jgi:plastocyanin
MTLCRCTTTLALLGSAAVLAACGGSSGGGTTAEPAPSTTSSGGGTQLQATVGPGFTIGLTQDGQSVTSLPAGTYTIVVDDEANIHDFHLTGPGVDEATDVAGTGTTTWTVELKPGEYRFVCDPHASSMHGSFTVQ